MLSQTLRVWEYNSDPIPALCRESKYHSNKFRQVSWLSRTATFPPVYSRNRQWFDLTAPGSRVNRYRITVAGPLRILTGIP